MFQGDFSCQENTPESQKELFWVSVEDFRHGENNDEGKDGAKY